MDGGVGTRAQAARLAALSQSHLKKVTLAMFTCTPVVHRPVEVIFMFAGTFDTLRLSLPGAIIKPVHRVVLEEKTQQRSKQCHISYDLHLFLHDRLIELK